MDGIVRKSQKSAIHKLAQQASFAHKNKTKQAQTLNRKGLKKPNFLPEFTLEQNQSQPKGTALKDRMKRAKTISKSNKIGHFARPSTFARLTTPLEVKPHENNAKKAKSHPKHQENPIVHFEKAIEDASSHLNKYADQKKKRFFKSKKINAIAGSLAVLLLVGFFGYQNAPNLEMRLASSKAGISASLPSYSPAGFGVAGPIKSQPGKITVAFKSRTDDRQYTVTQSASNWSSDALSVQLASKDNKQTWQEQGKTIFTYDNSDASWVDGGVLYQIEGNSDLTSEQLRRIVDSF